MLEIHKRYVTNENMEAIAVQIPIDDFEKIEEVLENFGLVRLMEEAESDDIFSKDEAVKYYFSLKNNNVGS